MDPEMRAAMVSAYDAHASDREDKGEPAWRSEIREDFLARVRPGGRILEIGAGVGYTAAWFKEQGADVVATDLSPENVALCRAKGVTAEVRDMSDLGFEDGTFAGVWAASCLMHIPSDELPAVLGEVVRVLEPGGLFWAGTWGSDTPQEGIWEEDWIEPKRFYAIRSDEAIRSQYEARFEVISFTAFRPESDNDWHYQSALLRASAT